jgi:hypothetical protein
MTCVSTDQVKERSGELNKTFKSVIEKDGGVYLTAGSGSYTISYPLR